MSTCSSTPQQRIQRICAQLTPQQCAGGCGCCDQTSTTSTKTTKQPLRVLITGAAGQIAYSLLPTIACGRMFGFDQPVVLHLLDIPPAKQALTGVVMELNDCAFPLLHGIIATTEPREAFNRIDAAIMVGAFPRKKGMERKDLLEKNANIFQEQGRYLSEFASPNVKVLVVGNPANTNALTMMHCAPNIPRENFSALTRLDHNRATAQIATKLNVPVKSINNVIIWGNHSATQYPDINHSYIDSYPANGLRHPTRSAVNNDEWLRSEFIPTVRQRGAAVIKARGLSSAASAANAIVDHMHDWFLGTKPGTWVSMGVVSDGSYGITRGLIYSFPVTCEGGNHSIVQGLNIDEFSREQMEKTENELIQERETAASILNQ